MGAVERWLKAAEEVYRGEDDGRLFDRAMRVKGDVDRVVFDFLILQELRAIRAALEAEAPAGKAKR